MRARNGTDLVRCKFPYRLSHGIDLSSPDNEMHTYLLVDQGTSPGPSRDDGSERASEWAMSDQSDLVQFTIVEKIVLRKVWIELNLVCCRDNASLAYQTF